MTRSTSDDTGNLLVTGPSLNSVMARLCVVLAQPSVAFRDELWSTVTRRGGPVREFNGMVNVTIEDIQRRLCWLPERKLNPWVTLAEFPWIIAGRSDISWLLPYLPRAADFSDDGVRWRAGYGPRLRGWVGTGGFQWDQLQMCVERLVADPASRQAVISLWGSERDYVRSSKDYPCTNWLHFMVRAGEDGERALDLTVVMRSNDLFWGFSGVNVTNFTLLQQLVAACIGVKPGRYRHACDNLHVYERNFGDLARIASAEDPEHMLQGMPPIDMNGEELDNGARTLDWFTDDCRRALHLIEGERVRNKHRFSTPEYWRDAIGGAVDSYLPQWAYFMTLHHSTTDWSQMNNDMWLELLEPVARPDWRLSAAALIERTRAPKFEGLLERVVNATVQDSEATRRYLERAVYNTEKQSASTEG
jgi:thymidylate synthase